MSEPKHGDEFDTPFGKVRCDATIPEDEIHMETSRGLVKWTGIGKPKAIEPNAIEQMPRGYFLGIDPAIGQDKMVQLFPPAVDPEYVSPLMRRLGYTRNPADCGHYKKRLYLGTTQWICSECGERL